MAGEPDWMFEIGERVQADVAVPVVHEHRSSCRSVPEGTLGEIVHRRFFKGVIYYQVQWDGLLGLTTEHEDTDDLAAV